MMNGSRWLEGYVPDVDATVVTRILDAGGVVAGKAACEDLCFSAGSHTCATGPIRNPHNPVYSTGGSSGGSAALVAAGEVEMALGGDQGGSIRTPSAWCGVYGLKPTWGLVPMTGGMPISYSVDHCGPICNSVENVARLLTAIAGQDEHDPRTVNAVVGDYMGALGHAAQRPEDRRAARRFWSSNGRSALTHDRPGGTRGDRAVLQSRGASVQEVSVPMHYDGPHIWTGVILEGAAEMMLKGFALGNNWTGYYTTSLQEAFAHGWRAQPDNVSETVKLVLLLGEYMHRKYHNRYHAKAQNIRVLLRKAYDTVLERFDLMAMPTIPFPATRIPAAGCVAGGVRRCSAQHAAKYVSIRRIRPSCVHDSLRHGRRVARRDDAGRSTLRRGDAAPSGTGVRGHHRLEDSVSSTRLRSRGSRFRAQIGGCYSPSA